MPLDLAMFAVMNDAAHVPASTVAMAGGVGILCGERPERLTDDAR
jgi:hypothetical protein